MSHAHTPITPLPKDQMVCVLLIQLCEALNINVLFPFMAFMVEDFGYTGEQLGYYVGGLAAAFCTAQFFSSLFWGKMSDIYGRKPSILIGTMGTIVGMIIFGMSRTYLQAVIGRFVAGLLSGNIGVMKTYVTEITDDSNRAAGFSYLSSAWAVGCIIAPLFGGLLSQPVQKFPAYFSSNGIFNTYPYFLPCLLCVLLQMLSALICVFVMKETRVLKVAPGVKSSPSSSAKEVEMTQRAAQSPNKKYTIVDEEESEEDVGFEDFEMTIEEGGKARASADIVLEDEEEEEEDEDDVECFLCASKPPVTGQTRQKGSTAAASPMHSVSRSKTLGEYAAVPATSGKGLDESTHKAVAVQRRKPTSSSRSKEHKPSRPLRKRVVILACLNYMVLCMAFILFDETLPLYLKLDKNAGGFSFSSVNIGSLLSATGVFLLIYAVFVLPKVGKYSKKAIFHYSLLGAILHVLLWPLAGQLNLLLSSRMSQTESEAIMYPILFLLASFKVSMASGCFMASTIQVNHSVHVEDLGTVNGFGQALGALARGIGPALGGVLWSTSTSMGFVYMNFIAVGLLWLLNMYINSCLPLSLDMKKMHKGEKAAHAAAGSTDDANEDEEIAIEF